VTHAELQNSIAPRVRRCTGTLNNIVEQDHRAIKRRCAAMK
jgi:transposase-like protein